MMNASQTRKCINLGRTFGVVLQKSIVNARSLEREREELKKKTLCYENIVKRQTADHSIALVAQIKRHIHINTIDWEFRHMNIERNACKKTEKENAVKVKKKRKMIILNKPKKDFFKRQECTFYVENETKTV